MQLLGTLFTSVMSLMQFEFTLWGYTFTFWQFFVFDVVIGAVLWFVWEVLLGD